MTAYTSITFETRDGVGHIVLNRPESANTLNATLSSEMMDAVVRCEDDANVRAVVITGAGQRFFCAGADLKGFYSPGSELKSRVSVFHAVLQKVGPGAAQKLRERVAAEIKTTFASHYDKEISLAEALRFEEIAVYSKTATGKKYLINPNKGIER